MVDLHGRSLLVSYGITAAAAISLAILPGGEAGGIFARRLPSLSSLLATI
ncbi:hypothetical protein [Cupriavidus necator]